MAREYLKENYTEQVACSRRNAVSAACAAICLVAFSAFIWGSKEVPLWMVTLLCGVLPGVLLSSVIHQISYYRWIERERALESERRGGKAVLGFPPERRIFDEALAEVRKKGRIMMDRYLVGFELDTGAPIWVTDEDLCSHACVFAKTGVGKTLWLEGLMFQQMARGRASGFTFIDAKRDPGTLADIILMALITGRIEDLVVVDPFDPVCTYNFVFTPQRPDVKARKVLRCGLPPIGDDSPAKHYDRLAADAVSRLVRALESFGLAWSVKDIAVALSAFNLAYPRLRALLVEKGSPEAVIELGHLASTYRTPKGGFDTGKITENLRGIASELHSISNSEAGMMFCAPRADLSLTDAIIRGKLIYYMLPRLEEAESADRMVKVFREDLEVSIGEITSNRNYRLEDPHMVIIDEGASTFGPSWANLFELARKGRFALLFGAQSVSGLMDKNMGLSEEFYQRVIANVNLKVIMRLGDNKTAEDMCEWIGKVVTTKRSLAYGASVGVNARELTKNIEINRMSSDTIRSAVNMSDDEDDLVSAEELKHEMSAEKGLAWFDVGDGRLRKGRSIWFDSNITGNWEGREHLVRYDMVEGDEIGLAEWVDEHILSLEKADQARESERSRRGEDGDVPSRSISAAQSARAPSAPPGQGGGQDASSGQESPSKSSFRINLVKPLARGIKARVSVFKEKPITQSDNGGEARTGATSGVAEEKSIAEVKQEVVEGVHPRDLAKEELGQEERAHEEVAHSSELSLSVGAEGKAENLSFSPPKTHQPQSKQLLAPSDKIFASEVSNGQEKRGEEIPGGAGLRHQKDRKSKLVFGGGKPSPEISKEKQAQTVNVAYALPEKGQPKSDKGNAENVNGVNVRSKLNLSGQSVGLADDSSVKTSKGDGIRVLEGTELCPLSDNGNGFPESEIGIISLGEDGKEYNAEQEQTAAEGKQQENTQKTSRSGNRRKKNRWKGGGQGSSNSSQIPAKTR